MTISVKYWALSLAKTSRTPLPPWVLILLPFKMLNVLKRMKKQFCNCFFFDLSWKFNENWQFLEQKRRKMTITRKIGNLIFLSIQEIPDLHVNLTTFEKKNSFFILMLHVYVYRKPGFSNMPLIPTCSDWGPPTLKKIPQPR